MIWLVRKLILTCDFDLKEMTCSSYFIPEIFKRIYFCFSNKFCRLNFYALASHMSEAILSRFFRITRIPSPSDRLAEEKSAQKIPYSTPFTFNTTSPPHFVSDCVLMRNEIHPRQFKRQFIHTSF